MVDLEIFIYTSATQAESLKSVKNLYKTSRAAKIFPHARKNRRKKLDNVI